MKHTHNKMKNYFILRFLTLNYLCEKRKWIKEPLQNVNNLFKLKKKKKKKTHVQSEIDRKGFLFFETAKKKNYLSFY